MRRIGDLFKELGFNKDAPLETQKAFVRHLVNEADKSANPIPILKTEGAQLSFDHKVLGIVALEPRLRKIK